MICGVPCIKIQCPVMLVQFFSTCTSFVWVMVLFLLILLTSIKTICEERVLLCHLSPSVCFMVSIWTVLHFFLFYPHFIGRKQFILHQSFSPVIYTPGYFHFWSLKRVSFLPIGMSCFSKANTAIACQMPGSAVLQLFITQNFVTLSLISEIQLKEKKMDEGFCNRTVNNIWDYISIEAIYYNYVFNVFLIHLSKYYFSNQWVLWKLFVFWIVYSTHIYICMYVYVQSFIYPTEYTTRLKFTLKFHIKMLLHVSVNKPPSGIS